MLLTVLASLSLVAAAQQPLPGGDPGTSYLFRVPATTPPALRAVIEQRFDCLCQGPAESGAFDVVVLPEEVASFRALAPRGTTLVARGRPYREIARSNPLVGIDPGYFTVPEIEQEMAMLAAANPGLAQRVDLSALPGAARTHNGHAIYALKVSDNVATDEVEPAIVIAAQHHARELNSPFMVIGAMRRVLQLYATDPAIRAAVDRYEIYFVPCVNPDGVDWVWSNDNFWRKNRRNNGGSFGVDNNRNYPFMWNAGGCAGSTTPSSQTYKGPSPGSEPETRTMMAVQRELRPVVYIDFHSSGRDILLTYNSCAQINPSLRSFLDAYVGDLQTQTGYASRFPSASGEAPEFHWADGGTNSFLIEIMTAFQPPFADVIVEEQTRTWPAVRRVLTVWAPALQGRVRSLDGSPLAASITYTPNLFNEGEQVAARGRDGLYHLWLPSGGSYQVTFSAPGHRPVTRTVTVGAYNQAQNLDVCLEPTWAQATLTKTGSDRLGTVTSLAYSSPGDAGDRYLVALAIGAGSGFPVGCDRIFPLDPDPLFVASLLPGSPLQNNIGVLPGSAQATALLPIPPLAVLVGITVHAAGATVNDLYPTSIKKFSGAVAITFQQ